jgi:hypothetical protein
LSTGAGLPGRLASRKKAAYSKVVKDPEKRTAEREGLNRRTNLSAIW